MQNENNVSWTNNFCLLTEKVLRSCISPGLITGRTRDFTVFTVVDTSPCSAYRPISEVDRGQTREICEKQENYFRGKVVTCTVQSLLLY